MPPQPPPPSSGRRRRQWSAELCKADHRELQATAMGLDCTGSLALLAGRRHSALVQLHWDSHNTLEITGRISKSSNNCKLEVAKVAWNPSSAAATSVSLVSADRIEVRQLTPSCTLPLLREFREGHSRSLVDASWCEGDNTNLLASGSADGFVKVWDTRSAEGRPVASLFSMTAVSHVQWRRQSNHSVASTHGGDVRLWDIRSPSYPVSYVNVHHNEILSFDWSRSGSCKEFATSDRDCDVKFFPAETEESKETCEPKQTLKTSVPVWKARYTPFGSGLATVIAPHLSHDADHSLFLWDATCCLDYPLHCFFGHRDVILDFDWRKRGDSFQLLTWSRDNTLRLWPVNTSLQTASDGSCFDATSYSGADEDEDAEVTARFNNISRIESETEEDCEGNKKSDDGSASQALAKPGESKCLQSDKVQSGGESTSNNDSDKTPTSREGTLPAGPKYRDHAERSSESALRAEFDDLNVLEHSRVLKIEDLSEAKRVCRVSSTLLVPPDQTMLRIFLRINFPPGYPSTATPTFVYGKGTTLDSATRAAIFKSLKSVSRRSARPCLDAVLRQLASAIDALERGERLLSPLAAAAAASAATVSETQIGGGYAASDEHAFNKITEGDGVSSVDRFSDSNVPYPRTSGATFAGNGHIVCFTMLNQNLSLTASSSSSSRKTTPRSYSAYSAPAFPTHRRSPGSSTQSTLQSSTTTGWATVNSGGDSLKKKGRFKVRRIRSGSTEADDEVRDREEQSPGAKVRFVEYNPLLGSASATTKIVAVYNVAGLFSFDRRLATQYHLRSGWGGGDARAACIQNSSVAARAGRSEDARLWTVCAQIAETAANYAVVATKRNSDVTVVPLSHHPMGRPLLTSIMRHLVRKEEIQVAAIIACIFKPGDVPQRKRAPAVATQAPSRPNALPRIETPWVENTTGRRHRGPHSQAYSPTTTPPPPPRSTGPPQRKTSKFWFLKPGALPATVAEGSSPYHTIHVASTSRNTDGDASPKKSDPRSSSAKRRKKKSAAAPGSVAHSVQQALAPPPQPPPPSLNKPHTSLGSNLSSVGSESNLEQFVSPHFLTWNRANRSNSWSEAAIPTADDAAAAAASNVIDRHRDRDSSREADEDGERVAVNWSELLDPDQAELYESLKMVYANILMNWGLLTERSAVLKNSNRPTFIDGHDPWVGGLEMAVDCGRCGVTDVASGGGGVCHGCGSVAMRCCVCQLPVRGLASACEKCLHGGHWSHLRAWFRDGMEAEATCPTGCGCKCWANDEEKENVA